MSIKTIEIPSEFIDESGQIIYPDSDGKPMSDNTLQFEWIVTIKNNLEILFAPRADVFVAGDLLWYPVEGQPQIRVAPDCMVVIGRPKGYRGSYQQWKEDNIIPQVVFEILSPGNTVNEMLKKWHFYNNYGVEEYYLYDPDEIEFYAWTRTSKDLVAQTIQPEWISPRLGIKFILQPDTLTIYDSKGNPFLTHLEKEEAFYKAQEAEQKAKEAEQKAKEAEQKAKEDLESEKKAKQLALEEIERLKALLNQKD